MIWFFLAGYIAGVVGAVMYANWWVGKHVTFFKIEEKQEEKKKDDGA